jgi:hypothetical protein
MVEHLTDEEISDAADGAVPASVEAHMGDCASCLQRFEAVRAVVAAVAATPPRPAEAEREAAVAHALAFSGRAKGGRARPVTPWLAVAAAVALLLGVGATLVARSGDSHDTQTASQELSKSDGGTGAATAAGPADGGDLGDQADAAALHGALEARLGGAGAAGTAAAAGRAADASAQPTAPAADQRANVMSAPAGAGCEAEARAAASGRAGGLLLTARLRWMGEPAVALVFAGEGQLGRRAFVMARRDCRLLVAQSF